MLRFQADGNLSFANNKKHICGFLLLHGYVSYHRFFGVGSTISMGRQTPRVTVYI